MKGATKRASEWYTPAPDKSAYAPSPHVAPDFYSLFSQTERLLIDWLKSPKVGRRQENDSWVCGQWSYARIAREVKLHWTTVRRAVAGLKSKQSLDTREVWASDRKGGRRVGTLYTIPSYDDALARRRLIPGVAVTALGHVVYLGRAKRIMTREVAAEWRIDLAKAPRSAYSERRIRPANPAQAMPAVAERPAAPANGPPPEEEHPATTMTKPDPLPREVLRTLKDCVRQRMFSRGIAERLVLNARKIAVLRGMVLTDEDIVVCIQAGWEAAKRDVGTIAFFNSALPEKVNALLDERADRIAAWKQAGGTCPDCGGRGLRQIACRGGTMQVRCDCTPLEKFKQLKEQGQGQWARYAEEEDEAARTQRATG
jgi:hypothetical protein